MLSLANKAEQTLTKASCSWKVVHVQTHPPFQSLQKTKRTGHRAACHRAGREVEVRRQQGWRGHWEPRAGPQEQMENEDGCDGADGMVHRWGWTTGPPLSPRGTSENDKEETFTQLDKFRDSLPLTGALAEQLSSDGTRSSPLRVHALWGGIRDSQHETKMKDRGQCGTLPPKESTLLKMTVLKCPRLVSIETGAKEIPTGNNMDRQIRPLFIDSVWLRLNINNRAENIC